MKFFDELETIKKFIIKNILKNEKVKKMSKKNVFIYPSYSLRSYKTNKYILDSDPAFRQTLAEIKAVKDLFNEINLIIPKNIEKSVMLPEIKKEVNIIKKNYGMNVKNERFRKDDKEFFKSLDLQNKDIFYTNFLTKKDVFINSGIDIRKTIFTFLYFYPKICFSDFNGIEKALKVIFRTEKAREHFLSNFHKLSLYKTEIIRAYHESFCSKKIIIPEDFDRKRILLIPSRFTVEDHNHSFKSLSYSLLLKSQMKDKKPKVKLIIANPNYSLDKVEYPDLVDVLGPLSRNEYERLLREEVGLILSLKLHDFDSSKGAPEYLYSNLIFLSNDYQINPINLPINPEILLWKMSKLISCGRKEYVEYKKQQKKIAEKYHGLSQIKNGFKKILKEAKF